MYELDDNLNYNNESTNQNTQSIMYNKIAGGVFHGNIYGNSVPSFILLIN